MTTFQIGHADVVAILLADGTAKNKALYQSLVINWVILWLVIDCVILCAIITGRLIR